MVAGLLVLTSLAVASPGASSSDDEAPELDPGYLNANPDGELIDAAEAASGLYDEPGFGIVEMDYAQRRVIIRWKGRPPEAVTDLIAAAPKGIGIVVEPADFSESEVPAAGHRLFEEARERDDLDISMVEPLPDRSGLDVYLLGYDASRITPQAESELREELSRVAGVPVVKIVEGEGIRGLGRWDDAAPWIAGGALGVIGGVRTMHLNSLVGELELHRDHEVLAGSRDHPVTETTS